MSALLVTYLKTIPNYNQIEESQSLEVETDKDISFTTILMKENIPGGKRKVSHYLNCYGTSWVVVLYLN